MVSIGETITFLTNAYNAVYATLPNQLRTLVIVAIFAVLIFFYAVFTWYFYRNLSKKDIIDLNLSRYNTADHPFLKKFYASLIYILENLIVLPFLIFFWIAVLAIIMLLFSTETTAFHVIMVSSAIVAAIRISAYYDEDLSRDLAKLFPFTLLTILLLSPDFFSIPRIIGEMSKLSTFFSDIIYFFLFVIALEAVLRILETFTTLKESINN